MNKERIYKKFGNYFHADEITFKMGIDHRITKEIARRFAHLHVLETCTGGGFSTIALAREAQSVTTVEINKTIQDQARENVKRAGLLDNVSFIVGDVLNEKILESLLPIDAAFLDPDWADTAQDHVYRFINSNTKPPADILLKTVFKYTKNIALILPPYIKKNELTDLQAFELQNIYLDGELVLFCLYFGILMYENKETNLFL